MLTDRIAIKISTSRAITCAFGAGSTTSSSALPLSTWTMLAVRLTYLATTGNGYYISINFGSTSVAQDYASGTSPPTFTNTDVTRLGGFVGEVANLQIFTPGTHVVNERNLFI